MKLTNSEWGSYTIMYFALLDQLLLYSRLSNGKKFYDNSFYLKLIDNLFAYNVSLRTFRLLFLCFGLAISYFSFVRFTFAF